MSTRATITIRQHDGTQGAVHLYHHHDGYPEGLGCKLASALRRAGPYTDPYMLATELIAERSGYELTRRADLHADREWHYELVLQRGGPLVLVDYFPIVPHPQPHRVFAGDLTDYRRWLAARLRRLLPRWRELRRPYAA